MLELSGVHKAFPDGTVALTEIDLAVDAGEFVSIVGPSGCGKSTLLRIASGLVPATAGAVATGSDRIGYVFQDPTLLPWRSVQRNVELLAELRGMPKADRRRRADEAIKLVGLEDFRAHQPRSLSGGMRMRVSLARSLMLDPDLFLLDEPFGALDEITRQRLGAELQEFFLAQRFAAIFVTHSVTEAVYLSNRVLVMSDRPGRIHAEFVVPFEHPRPASLRFSGAFARLSGQVSTCLERGPA